MLPQGPRLAIRRLAAAKVLPWGFLIPVEDRGLSYVGEVIAAGPGYAVDAARLPLEVGVGDRVIYSTRVDTFTKRGEPIDLVEEASVIGVCQ